MNFEKIIEKYADSHFMRFLGTYMVWLIIYAFLYYVCGLSEGPAEETRGIVPFLMMILSATSIFAWLENKRKGEPLQGYVQEALERFVVFFGLFVVMYSILTISSWLGSAETLPYNTFILTLMIVLICVLSFIIPLVPDRYRKYFL